MPSPRLGERQGAAREESRATQGRPERQSDREHTKDVVGGGGLVDKEQGAGDILEVDKRAAAASKL